MQFRRFVFGGFLGTLLIAAPAAAGSRHHHERRIDSVTIRPEGRGSLLAVTFAGEFHTRLLRSSDRIQAYAVADVDNDGDLDILAASTRHGLLLWRNSGRGHFELARPPRSRAPALVRSGLRRFTHPQDGPSAVDDRYDAALPRAPAVSAAAEIQTPAPNSSTFFPFTTTTGTSGRAPPTL